MSKTKKAAAIKASVKSSDSPLLAKLHRLHKRLALAYGLQSIVLLLLAPGLAYPVTIASELLFTMSLSQVLALSLAISGTFHALQAFSTRFQYEAALDRRENPYRWLENAFSASLLPLAIGLVVGLRDVTALAMLFILGFITHVLGWQLERQLASKQSMDARRTFVLLAVASLTVWAAVGSYAVQAAVSGKGLPWYGFVAYVLGLIFVAGIGWVIVQYRDGRGKWHDYLYFERTMVLAGFAAKSSVAWVLFTGIAS